VSLMAVTAFLLAWCPFGCPGRRAAEPARQGPAVGFVWVPPLFLVPVRTSLPGSPVTLTYASR